VDTGTDKGIFLVEDMAGFLIQLPVEAKDRDFDVILGFKSRSVLMI
jgi:hypothetical protein